MKSIRKILTPALCASMLATALPAMPAAAAPMPKPGISAGNLVELAGRRGYYRRGPSGAGIVGAIIAGTIIAAAISEGRADKRDLRRCDRDFPDFDYRRGTYIDRYGDERVCPYLR